MRDVPSPRIRPLEALYLDFDGVLHPEDVHGAWGVEPKLGPDFASMHRLFEHAELLAVLLAPYPEVHIVLSTSWVRVKSYSAAVKRLPPVLAVRCCGATWHTEMRPMEQIWEQLPRGRQVLADVERRRPRRWIALDDDPSGWSPFESNLVLTDPVYGIASPSVLEELEAKLAVFDQGSAADRER
jgi:hypothetical protein